MLEQYAAFRRPKKPPRGRRFVLAMAAWLAAVGCGQVERGPIASTATAPNPTKVVATRSEDSIPEGPDAPPRVSLAVLQEDGSFVSIPGEYIDAVEFRNGQAAVTHDRELHLVHTDGAKSVLARHVDGLPARATDGTLVYTARFGDVVEIYWLTMDGTHHRVASFEGSATRLSPQDGRRVVFVGAKRGGVSGIWIADSKGARCLTNCALRVGVPRGDTYLPPPGDASTVRIIGNIVKWRTPEGTWQSVPLVGEE